MQTRIDHKEAHRRGEHVQVPSQPLADGVLNRAHDLCVHDRRMLPAVVELQVEVLAGHVVQRHTQLGLRNKGAVGHVTKLSGRPANVISRRRLDRCTHSFVDAWIVWRIGVKLQDSRG